MVLIRHMTADDCTEISAAFSKQGWDKPESQYESYWHETVDGTRVVLLAEIQNQFAGYLTIVWCSDYPPFRERAIPEVVDFNVLIKFQRQGVGTALMDEAEALIAEQSAVAGIGVGLMHDYGKAQILYAKRGYVPDGRGIFAHGRWLSDGDEITIDHDIALYLTKNLSTEQA